MKHAYWLALFMFLPFCCVAQSKIDSLKALLENVSMKGDRYNVSPFYYSHIGWEFLSAREYDSALTYYYRALKGSPPKELIATTFNCMGIAYNFKAFPDSSIVYYNKALQLFEQAKDTLRSVIAENNLSIIYKDKGWYEKALETAFAAISKLERQGPSRTLASSYNTVGTVYAKINDHLNALDYYIKALNTRRSIGYDSGIGQSYNNIGELYLHIKNYDSALSNLQRSVATKKKINDPKAIGTTLNLIGEVYLHLNQLTEAEKYLLEARKIKAESGERLEETTVLNNLGRMELLRGNLNLAEQYLAGATMLAKSVGALEEMRKNLELKVLLFQAKQDYLAALSYAQQLIIIKDSILNAEKAQSLLSLQTRYETENKERLIDLLERDKALQLADIASKKNWIRSLFTTTILITIIGVVIFYTYKQSQRARRKVETLLKELHHRVKNNLQILSSILSLQTQYITDKTAVQLVKTSESRVNTMALIHKKLYKDKNNRTVDLQEYCEELVQYLLHTYGFDNKNLNLDLSIDRLQLDVDKAIPVGLILNETVSNSLKYAYIDHETPELKIQLRRNGEDRLVILIADNGPGMASTKADSNFLEASTSFGWKLINTLTKELNGKLSVQSTCGTVIELEIPI